jgi:hypothetical protein|tara:strand:- start:291 stop:446 length:156 start_codon:yes stop_codon:yes gene_type:complete
MAPNSASGRPLPEIPRATGEAASFGYPSNIPDRKIYTRKSPSTTVGRFCLT